MESVCGNCEESQPATKHCYDCRSNWCDTCSNLVHNGAIRAFRGHSIVPVAEYLAYMDPHTATDSTHFTDASENTFVYWDEGNHSLCQGPKFYSMEKSIKGDELMSVVSFVGPTGGGKSTLIRLCCTDRTAKPLCALPNTADSTSANIHAYSGSFPTQTRPSKTLLLDCEGSGGTAPKSWTACLRQYGEEKLQELFKKRVPIVNSSYPRMLYMFSSVFCFVSTASPKEQQTLINHLTLYAKQASAATVNQLSIPALVIIYNKVTEGIWDIEQASLQLKHLTELKDLFSDIYVVHIPDRAANGKQYAIQVNALKLLIAKCMDNQQLFLKHTIMQLFSFALPEFSKNTDAVFNFMDIAIRNMPLPKDYPTYLQEFFLCLYAMYSRQHKGPLGTTLPQVAFALALSALAKRLKDSFYHHIVRSHIVLPPGISAELKQRIDDVEDKIQQYAPCQAIRQFPGHDKPVHCENLLGSHRLHQSSLTYTVEVPCDDIIGKLFSMKTNIPQSCQWDGAIEMPQQYTTPGWLSKSVIDSSQPLVAETFLQEHKELLHKQREIITEVERSTDNVCAACLLSTPTELLQCSHKLCVSCCKELILDEHIECPICAKIVQWSYVNVPDSAGFRILNIEGGVLGVIPAVVLTEIEKCLGIPIHLLFDLIVGTSTGAINAIGFGALKLPAKDVEEIFQRIFSDTSLNEQPYSFINEFIFGAQQFQSKPLHNTLAEVIPTKNLFGCSQFPRVAVVACDGSSGRPKELLLTSYCVAEGNTIRNSRASLIEVIEASIGAGIFFPPLSTPFGQIMDGGIACQNPCFLAYKEAKLLWPGKSLDVLLSIGSGICLDNNISIKKDSFLQSAKKEAMDCVKRWDDFKEQIGEKATRLPAATSYEYELAATVNLTAQYFIRLRNTEFLFTCHNLLAKLFYLESNAATKVDCILNIRRRIELEHFPQARSMELPKAFTTDVKFAGRASPLTTCTIAVTEWGAQIDIRGMPERGDIEVTVFCHLTHNGSISKEGIPISGCPLVIKRH